MKHLIKRMLSKMLQCYKYRLLYTGLVQTDADYHRTVYNAYHKGKCFCCVKNTSIAECVLMGGIWDPKMEEFVSNSLKLKPKGIVVEVGANIGASIIPFCSSFHDTEFHLFEPMPFFFELLCKNKESYNASNAYLNNISLSDRDNAEITLDCDDGNAGKVIYDNLARERYTVKTAKLDTLLGNRDIAFLKIDVDGYEKAVLEGAASVLKRSKPNVFIEYHVDLMKEIGVNPFEIIKLLHDAGINQYHLYTHKGDFIEKTEYGNRVVEVAENNRPYIDILATN